MAKIFQKLAAYGGNGGNEWDDGVYHGVKKLWIGHDYSRVNCIKIEYDNGGEVVTRVHGKVDRMKEFELDYPKEYITSIEGTVITRIFSTEIITSLTFKTSYGRTSPTFGPVSGTKFTLEDKGRKLVGFYGRTGDALDSIGAYFSPILSTAYPIYNSRVRGGNGGVAWDDGFYEGLKKVYVGRDSSRISYMKFEYVSDGKSIVRHHGKIAQAPMEFVLDYPHEYIVAMEGTYSSTLCGPTVVTSLTFKTSKQRSSPTYGSSFGTKFVLQENGRKLVGFHGREGSAIDAIGAYFLPVSSLHSSVYQLEAYGGEGGLPWDDDAYDGIRKVYVGKDNLRIAYLKFEYEKGSELESKEHGKRQQDLKEFVLDPDEHITSVEGTYDNTKFFGSDIITSLIFKTSKNRASSTFGNPMGTSFVLEKKGFKLVGFHGRHGDAIDALGAYFGPIVLAKKIQGQGGNAGNAWDDGVHDVVRKIYVGQGDSGVSFLKVEYDSNSKLVVGTDHGKMTLLGTEEFELNYPDEYITSVEGTYDKVYGVEAEIITMLRFKTNKRTSQPFGLEAGTKFALGENDSKVVGFHGKAGEVVHQVGIHVLPLKK